MRTVKRIEFRGRSYSARELSELTGVSPRTIRIRLDRGWTAEQAATIPTPKQRRRGIVSTLDGVTLPLPSSNTGRPGVSADLGMKLGTGAGSTAQERTEIGFSKEAENA